MAKQTIGAFLATLRKARGYTQIEVADKLGISNRTLSAWETYKAYPDLLSVPALADIYGVTADEILRGERAKNADGEALIQASIKNQRSALKNQLTRFTSRSYVARGLFIAGSALDALAFFSGFAITILLVIGIACLTASVIVQAVFYNAAKNSVRSDGDNAADGGEALCGGEYGSRFFANISACNARYVVICAVCLIAQGILFLLSAIGGFGAVMWIVAPICVGCGIVCVVIAEKKFSRAAATLGEEERAGYIFNAKLRVKCIAAFSSVLAAGLVALAIIAALSPLQFKQVVDRYGTVKEAVSSFKSFEVKKGDENWNKGVPSGVFSLSVPPYGEGYLYSIDDFYVRYTSFKNLDLYYYNGEEYLLVLRDAESVYVEGYGTVYDFHYGANSAGSAYFDVDASYSARKYDGGYEIVRTLNYTYSGSLAEVAIFSAVFIVLPLAVCGSVYAVKRKKIKINL